MDNKRAIDEGKNEERRCGMNNKMTTEYMSNEEVIEVLKGLVFGSFDRTTRKERQALDFAIKALEERPQGEPVIKCQDCKHQVKVWREDKRMGGYWVYDCDFISDPFESTPVCGQPEEYCSSAEKKGGAE